MSSLVFDLTIALCEEHESGFFFDVSFPSREPPAEGCYRCDCRLFRFTVNQHPQEIANEMKRVVRAIEASAGCFDPSMLRAYEHAPTDTRDLLEMSYRSIWFAYRQYYPEYDEYEE